MRKAAASTGTGLGQQAAGAFRMDDSTSRPAGLVVFGILQLILGIGAVLLVLGISATYEIAQQRGLPPAGAALASAVVVYGLAAIYLISVGVGSIRGRRWARSLAHVVSAIWAAAGIVTLLMMLILIPRVTGASVMRPAIMTLLVGVVLPLVLYFYYRRDDVRSACENLDFTVRWTDRVPPAVLAVVLVLSFAAISLLANLAAPSFVALGREVTGAPAALTMFAFAALSAVLAYQSYKLNESAWWTLLLLQLIGLAYAITSFLTVDFSTATAGTPLAVRAIYRDPLFVAMLAATWIAYFAFLLYIRRYFARPIEQRTRRDDQSRFAV
ncbi:MAG TPA: hypothetical protein VF057_02680 [Thermoanaerobaculia bacterium]